MSFVIMPGGDPSDINLKFNGQDSMQVESTGALKLYFGTKWLKLDHAMAYQLNNLGVPIALPWLATYDLESSSATVNFEFESYDPAKPLIFQIGYPPMNLPMGGGTANMEWSTYANAPEGDQLECVEVDEDGDPYLCGYTYGVYYPIAIGEIFYPATDPTQPGAFCAVTMKFDHLSKQILWASYCGGNLSPLGSPPADTEAHKLATYKGAAANKQYVFVTGSTNCVDFPVGVFSSSVFASADQSTYGGGQSRAWIVAYQKLNGAKHWSTTHGQPSGTTWSEHGLAVAVNDDGDLVMGGMIETYSTENVTPNFPTVTPSGSGVFSRSLGDGFFILFNNSYQIEWATTFCEYSGPAAWGKITDMRMVRTGEDGHDAVWMVGATTGGTPQPLDLVEPPSGGYFQSTSGQVSAVIALIDLTHHDIDYCTRWGGSGDASLTAAHGVHVSKEGVYVVGFTTVPEFSSTELPEPPGSGTAWWQTSNASTSAQQVSDAFILRFSHYSDNFALTYGTLFGGTRDDVFFDVNGDKDHVYITGEIRSASLAQNLNPDYYYQPFHNYDDRRDAIILGLDDLPHPNVTWRSAFGGTRSDRGWGIASSYYELYLCGATASQPQDAFPLLEFDTNSNLDWYWDLYLGGSSNPFVPYCSFNTAMDYEVNNIDVFIESYQLNHDGFIASFRLTEEPVGVEEATTPSDRGSLHAWYTGVGSLWALRAPYEGVWSVDVYDAAGRHITNQRFAGTNTHLDLNRAARGVYAVRAKDPSGNTFTTKILVP